MNKRLHLQNELLFGEKPSTAFKQKAREGQPETATFRNPTAQQETHQRRPEKEQC
jgi:hypothetical protein